MTALLEVRGLTKVFPIGKGENLVAVRDVSFALGRGETLGLVGESGSGKTTVGRCILRLLEPTAGYGPARRKRHHAAAAGGDARAPAAPAAGVPGSLRIAQSLASPSRRRWPSRSCSTASIAPPARPAWREMLRRVDLDERINGYYPADLTASEQQRVGIARALVTRPELVVLDEPTSTLDPSARAEILALLQAIQRETGTAYIFISHDLTSVARISHRIAVMYLGQIVEAAPTAVLMARQRHPYSRALLSAVLFADPLRVALALRHRRRDPDRDQSEPRNARSMAAARSAASSAATAFRRWSRSRRTTSPPAAAGRRSTVPRPTPPRER